MFRRMLNFLREVRVEMSKVAWPTRKELKDSTVVVLVAVFITAILTGGADRFFSFLLGLVMRQ